LFIPENANVAKMAHELK